MKKSLLSSETLKQIFQNHIPRPEGRYTYNAVLVLLTETKNGIEILFCQRSFLLKSQPGDICFPGGRAEAFEMPLETALRETEEEIGIKKERITIIGQPDYIITQNNRIVIPYLGLWKDYNLKSLCLAPEEVETVFTVPLSYFLETEPQKSSVSFQPVFPDSFPFSMIVGGRNYRWKTASIPELFYSYDGFVIWGMTARILYNCIQIIKKYWRE